MEGNLIRVGRNRPSIHRQTGPKVLSITLVPWRKLLW